jgi:hypothetical protein
VEYAEYEPAKIGGSEVLRPVCWSANCVEGMMREDF